MRRFSKGFPKPLHKAERHAAPQHSSICRLSNRHVPRVAPATGVFPGQSCHPEDTKRMKQIWMEASPRWFPITISGFFWKTYIANPQIEEVTIIMMFNAERYAQIETARRPKVLKFLNTIFIQRGWKSTSDLNESCRQEWAKKGWEWKLPRLLVVIKCQLDG